MHVRGYTASGAAGAGEDCEGAAWRAPQQHAPSTAPQQQPMFSGAGMERAWHTRRSRTPGTLVGGDKAGRVSHHAGVGKLSHRHASEAMRYATAAYTQQQRRRNMYSRDRSSRPQHAKKREPMQAAEEPPGQVGARESRHLRRKLGDWGKSWYASKFRSSSLSRLLHSALINNFQSK